MVSLAKSASFLKLDPKTVVARMLEGKLKATEIPDKRRGKRYDFDPVSLEEYKKELDAERAGDEVKEEITEHRRQEHQATNSFDIETVIGEAGMNKEQARMFRALHRIPKKESQSLLAASKALEQQNKNLLQSKNLISAEEFIEQLDRIHGVQFHNVKDMVESFIVKFHLTPAQAAEARVIFENVMRRYCDELRSLAG